MDHLAGVPEPYRLRVVAHSLGGAALLVYAVQCRRQRRPHHIYRLILLTPAGFLQKAPLVCTLLSRLTGTWCGLSCQDFLGSEHEHILLLGEHCPREKSAEVLGRQGR